MSSNKNNPRYKEIVKQINTYNKENTRIIQFRMNKNTEQDLIYIMQNLPEGVKKTTFIKQAILEKAIREGLTKSDFSEYIKPEIQESK